MIYERLPGPMIYADFAPGSWLLHFSRVPWPLWAAAGDVRRFSAFEWGLQWYWWHRHSALREPSEPLKDWLDRVPVPDQLYTPGELLHALVQCGCPFALMEDEFFSQRVLLMAHWNAWTQPVTGREYLLGCHHETGDVPQGLPVFTGRVADDFVKHSHIAQLLRFLEWQETYSLEELQAQVRRIYLGTRLSPVLERVAATWSEQGCLQAAQWVLGLHLELPNIAERVL